MKLIRFACVFMLAALLPACCCLREGVVISKRARKGMPRQLITEPFFRLTQPDIYWVQVEGQNAKGCTVRKNVILFRADWSRIRVGDHWSRGGGFTAAGPRAHK